MADNDEAETPLKPGQDPAKQMLDSAIAALNKGAKEGTQNALKDLLKKKGEHQRGIKLIDLEIDKLLSDFKAGLLT